MRRVYGHLLLCFAALLSLIPRSVPPAMAADPSHVEGPFTPRDSLRHFRLADDRLRLELVAAEPQVEEPVAIAFDEAGRMWVVEMRDYPHGPAEGETPRSRVKILEDRDGDGYFETATIFADQLLFATGLQPWRGGAWITYAGTLAWFADTDGDSRADTRQVWFTGFAEQNPQLRANHPTWGIDNRIYVANGLRGGTITAASPEISATPLQLRGMDLRFDPLSGQAETISGNGQFGLAFDDHGRRFICSNRNPCMHVVLEQRYLQRNPQLRVTKTVQDVSPAGADSRLYPLSRAWTTSNLHAGQFTAACGVTIYRGGLWPREYLGNSFTCEPTANLVHRDVLMEEGPSFRALPSSQPEEFLATPDTWFRPVFLANGPDGALYVVDMYRAEIEHPEWMPPEMQRRADFSGGHDRGRIYRVVPRDGDSEPVFTVAKLSQADTPRLVRFLEHPHAWQRETAARLLQERQDRAAFPHLESLLRESESPLARLHALWSLQGLGGLTWTHVHRALQDADAGVREHGVRLVEDWLPEQAEARQIVFQRLARDEDIRVRFQVALSGGVVPRDPGMVRALVRIARQDAEHDWTRQAILSSLAESAGRFLEEFAREFTDSSQRPNASELELASEVAALIGARAQAAELAHARSWLPLSRSHSGSGDGKYFLLDLACLHGLHTGLDTVPPPEKDALNSVDSPSLDMGNRFVTRLTRFASDAQSDITYRRWAIRLMKASADEETRAVLWNISEGEQPVSLRQEAARVLLRANLSDEEFLQLVHMAARETPDLRDSIWQACLASKPTTLRLLQAMVREEVAPGQLGSVYRQQLLHHRDPRIRELAKEIWNTGESEVFDAVWTRYRDALPDGAAPRGAALFRKHCATCHRMQGVGWQVGPNISDARDQSHEQLLLSVLDPNRAVDSNYFQYSLVRSDGEVITGIIASETPGAITIREAGGKETTLLRGQVEEIVSSGQSYMPANWQAELDPQEMADLIAYLKNWRYLDGQPQTPLAR